jgi:hypothetical protein
VPSDGSSLDPILEARLELLDQVLAEVEKVRKAMADQRTCLEKVSAFLGDDGRLTQLRRDLWTRLTDAETRLTGPPEESFDPGVERWKSAGAIDGAAHSVDSSAVSAGSSRREALQFIKDAKELVGQLGSARAQTFSLFQEVKRWSVVGLADPQLGSAARNYRRFLQEIRRSSQPWQTYETQLRGRGEQLFTRYLEILGSMAVRDFGVDRELVEDRQTLINLLLSPVSSYSEPPKLRIPNLLTGTEHVQLGYSNWSLWALPLVGRVAGLHLITSETFTTVIPRRLHTPCADIFATYALGPSYPCAAIFLELDPGKATGNSVSDAVRAEHLFRTLPELGGDSEQRTLQWCADTLRANWNTARAAVDANETAFPQNDYALADDFLDELRSEYGELAYDLRFLANPVNLGEVLAAEEEPSPQSGSQTIRDILAAMWLGRLGHPERTRVIYERAKTLAANSAGGPGPVQGRN